MQARPGSRWLALGALGAALLAPTVARATDGYFASGYGMIESGRGGAAIATADDAMGGANNPASMAFVPARLDLGMSLFMPTRSASRTGNAFGLNGHAGSGARDFPIPEFGYNRPLGEKWDIGLTIYGNGGMNTTYPGGQIVAGHCGPGAPVGNLLCGVGALGVDLVQMIIAPTIAYKLTPRLAIGISPLFAVQRFSADGLQAFTGLSSSASNVTNRGYAYSYGGGAKIGAYFQATPTLALGITYQTRLVMTSLSNYKGLFAEGGGFDIPAAFGVGAAWQATPKLRVALDYERIFYSTVRSIGNPSLSFSPLGSTAGPGFGWHDVNVFRLGVDYRVVPALMLRAGYNHSDNPIQRQDVTFNILAPGVVTNQVSLGFTWDIAPGYELSFAYSHAFRNTLRGPTSPLLPGGGTDTINLSEDQVGLALGIRL